ELPVEALAGASRLPGPIGVEQVKVCPICLGGLDVRRAAHTERLDDLAAGPAPGLPAEGGALAAVELDHGQRLILSGGHQLVQGRIDKSAHHLELSGKLGRDLHRRIRLAEARALGVVVQPNRPGPEARGVARVSEVRDAAEIDPHQYKDTGRLPSDRASGRTLPGLGRGMRPDTTAEQAIECRVEHRIASTTRHSRRSKSLPGDRPDIWPGLCPYPASATGLALGKPPTALP